ncbi:choice-of-anchor D domain-containing protein [Pelomonas sp. Root1237]|uniref:COG1470 family protein n=1 Tax=Pelomonas sp. Root1237 TaxID=1736434 RepID=UPI00138F90B5|nr:choice-of-anchor D domain-containing protein [Pelomonas sp. Root1237]
MTGGLSVPVYDSVVYDNKDTSALQASLGLRKIYVWPQKRLDEPKWVGHETWVDTDTPPPRLLVDADAEAVRQIGRDFCASPSYGPSAGVNTLVIDIEWHMQYWVDELATTLDQAKITQARLNFDNYQLLVKWVREGINENAQCRANLQFGMYGMPNAINADCLPAIDQDTDASNDSYSDKLCKGHRAGNRTLKNALRTSVDFVAPALYFDYSPNHTDYQALWEAKNTQTLELAREWQLPVIPFVGTRWFSDGEFDSLCRVKLGITDDEIKLTDANRTICRTTHGLVDYKERLLPAEVFRTSLQWTAGQHVGGIILWDADDFFTAQEQQENPQLANYGWFNVLKAWMAPDLEISYDKWVNPASVDLGAHTIGAAPEYADFKLTNKSLSTAATGLAFAIGGANDWVVTDNSCATMLGTQGSCSFRVKFQPAQTGARQAALTLSHAKGALAPVSLNGTGVVAAQVTSASFDVASIRAGNTVTFSWAAQNAASVDVSCTNGFAATGVGASGSIPVPVTVVGTLTCTATAKNTLNTPATRNANLTVDAAQASLHLYVGGLVDYPTVNWLNQELNSTTGSDLFALKNTNTVAAATGVSVTAPAGWQLYENNCTSGTLAANGGSCTFRLRFLPTQAQPYSGQLGLTLNNGTAPTVTLIGVGVQATLHLYVAGLTDYPTINWGNQVIGSGTGSDMFTLKNTSTTTAATGVSVTAPASWELYENTCTSGTLAANGGSCTFRIRFHPTAAQPYSGQLGLSLSNGTAPTVNLIGVGVQASLHLYVAGLTDYPTINWGNQVIGSGTGSDVFTLKNTSTTTVATGVSVTAPANWELYENTCTSGTLAANGGSCTFRIRFRPTAAQPYSRQLGLSLSNGTAPTVNLIGVGV